MLSARNGTVLAKRTWRERPDEAVSLTLVTVTSFLTAAKRNATAIR